MLYLTQDAGYTRRGQDGTLENMITGRIQVGEGGYVKIRGFRVELQEVEVVLRSQPKVKHAVVIAFKGELAAYVVLGEPLLAGANVEAKVREAIAGYLPVYAMPRWIEFLTAMPLSANGKLDRGALPEPCMQGGAVVKRSQKKNQALEVAVLAAAQSVGIRVASEADNIFTAGADSVAGLRLIFKLEKEHGVRLQVGELFSDGSIAHIVELLAGGSSEAGEITTDAVLYISTLVSAPSESQRLSKPPVFLCHGAGTTSLALAAFATSVADTTMFGDIFGISDSFLSGANTTFSFASIQDVAASMSDLIVSTIANKCVGNEVVLGGWSYGGVVAYACSQVLEARGIRVKCVVMLDSPLGQSDSKQLSVEAQVELLGSMHGELAERVGAHFDACNKLLNRYRPSPIASPVLDLRPPESEVEFLSQSERESLVPYWNRQVVDGSNHFALVQMPFVEKAAQYTADMCAK